MRNTLFISDLHLEDNAPERTEWLAAFLAGPAQGALVSPDSCSL